MVITKTKAPTNDWKKIEEKYTNTWNSTFLSTFPRVSNFRNLPAVITKTKTLRWLKQKQEEEIDAINFVFLFFYFLLTFTLSFHN